MNAKPYLKEMTWLGDYRKDFVLIDTKTNQTSLILAGRLWRSDILYFN
ncbi:MAG: hypothetical protein IPO48_09250 [Saprospiraceae bacterium]|nr:hypothetical protein [Saprospiraceae bacterium]